VRFPILFMEIFPPEDVQFWRGRGISISGEGVMIDQESLMILLLRERVKLLAYIRAIVRDEHLAEDVYQDVAVLAIRKCEEIEDQRHFLAWMRLTSRHRALKILQQRRRQVLLDESLLDRLDEQWVEHDQRSSADLTEALRQCLERLSPRARNLIRLRYAEGISGERLAADVDRSLNTVYVSLSRIHRSLGDCIRRRLA
jgi:RNA polymerase sigma-70 factor, ECF subfamily